MGVALVVPLKGTPHGTSLRQPCSTCAIILADCPIFLQNCTIACQTLVRFFVSFRIEPHVPLVVCLPANSFEFQPCGRTPQAACLTGYLRHTIPDKSGPMQLAGIRLQLGLRRSLICFAPLAFVSQRQLSSRDPPSPLVFPRVSTHFTTPP